MTRTTTLTRATTFVMTVVAAALFVVLCAAFGDGLLIGPIWNSARWLDSPLMTYLLLALIVAAGVVQANRLPADGVVLRFPRDDWTSGQTDEPRWAKLGFGNVFWALLWLPLRLFAGRMWLSAGLAKVGNAAWMDNGRALHAFWQNAVAANPRGQGKITYDWYRDLLRFMDEHAWYVWFAKLIVFGELLVGLALLVGALVGLAAFCGAFLNFNYGLAGTASGNPILLALGVLLVLAWRTAGYWGLDRWLLPALGVPWRPDRIVRPIVTNRRGVTTDGRAERTGSAATRAD
jgi:thiosulfate dehydrogenase (quinone) large subunit